MGIFGGPNIDGIPAHCEAEFTDPEEAKFWGEEWKKQGYKYRVVPKPAKGCYELIVSNEPSAMMRHE